MTLRSPPLEEPVRSTSTPRLSRAAARAYLSTTCRGSVTVYGVGALSRSTTSSRPHHRKGADYEWRFALVHYPWSSKPFPLRRRRRRPPSPRAEAARSAAAPARGALVGPAPGRPRAGWLLFPEARPSLPAPLGPVPRRIPLRRHHQRSDDGPAPAPITRGVRDFAAPLHALRALTRPSCGASTGTGSAGCGVNLPLLSIPPRATMPEPSRRAPTQGDFWHGTT